MSDIQIGKWVFFGIGAFISALIAFAGGYMLYHSNTKEEDEKPPSPREIAEGAMFGTLWAHYPSLTGVVLLILGLLGLAVFLTLPFFI